MKLIIIIIALAFCLFSVSASIYYPADTGATGWYGTNTTLDQNFPNTTAYTASQLLDISADYMAGYVEVPAIITPNIYGGHKIKFNITQDESQATSWKLGISGYFGPISAGTPLYSIELYNNKTGNWDVLKNGTDDWVDYYYAKVYVNNSNSFSQYVNANKELYARVWVKYTPPGAPMLADLYFMDLETYPMTKYYPNTKYSDGLNNSAWLHAKASAFADNEPNATLYTSTQRNTISSDDGNSVNVQAQPYDGHRIAIRVNESNTTITQLKATINGDYFQGASGTISFYVQIWNSTGWETFDSVVNTLNPYFDRTSIVTKTGDLGNYINASGHVLLRTYTTGGGVPVDNLDFVQVAVSYSTNCWTFSNHILMIPDSCKLLNWNNVYSTIGVFK